MANIPLKTCQQRLAVLWFVIGGTCVVLAIVQQASGHFDSSVADFAQRYFEWLLPAILPTLSFIVGTLVSNRNQERMADGFLFWLCFGISTVYLLIILFLMLSNLRVQAMMDIIEGSKWWMGPVQGIVTGVMGYFFFKEGEETEDEAGAEEGQLSQG